MPSVAQTTQSNFCNCSCTSGDYSLTCRVRQHLKMALSIRAREKAESDQQIAKEKQRIYETAHYDPTN
jgi:hypothetical protein